MSVDALLADLAGLGVRLKADGDRLRYFPRSAVTPAVAARMKTHKGELLAVLRAAKDGGLPDASVLWQAALGQLAGDPDFPPDVLDALRAADVRWACDEAPQEKTAASGVPAKPANITCRKCGSTRWRDVPIHEGRSVRRNCVRCGWLVGFPVWYGKALDQ